MAKASHTICVIGDVTLDCNIARLPARKSDLAAWDDKDQAMVTWERGGAALLADLIEAIRQECPVKEAKGFAVCGPHTPNDPWKDDRTPISRSYTVWTPHVVALDKNKDKGGEMKRVWRVSQFLGLSKRTLTRAAVGACRNCRHRPDILVINDADLGFRHDPRLWPAWLKDRRKHEWPRSILLKMSRPDFTSPLWKKALSRYADRVIVVCNANGLRIAGADRLGGAHISHGMSWERTAQDLLWELKYHVFGESSLSANAAAPCAYVVVSLGGAGAFLFSSTPPDARKPDERAWLIYDPQETEGAFEDRCPGQVMGYLSCTAAALTRALIKSVNHHNLVLGIRAGVQAYRHLHRGGYGEVTANPPRLPSSMAFPKETIAREVRASWGLKAASELPIMPVCDPAEHAKVATTSQAGEEWSILRSTFSGDLSELAKKIVIQGPDKALAGVPVAKFGALRTADRREIENYRNVRNLLCEFIRQPGSKPVSIAVFGPPGAGKSFGVKSIAEHLEESQRQPMKSKTFNLSQLDGPEELNAALHEVRDIGLSGKLPLIFWDEFDSALNGQPLGWLRLFLEPMQDGTFLQGQVTHPIGKAIFVFAGGTCTSLAEFDKGREDNVFREAKGPDFISRLRGFLDVLGPNPVGDDRSADPCFVVRRAILLQSMVSRIHPNVIDAGRLSIDPGVLGAFLEVSQYKHGARSMESIVVASTLTGKTTFDRSSIPPEVQLDVHVNGREFHSLVQQLDALENLARAIHENYRRCLERRGYRYARVADEKKRTSDSLVDFDRLSEDLKKSNRDAARTMPAKLAKHGYAIIPARIAAGIQVFPPDVLEKLAEDEHDRWLRAKLEDDWKYGTAKNSSKRTNPAILTWDKLEPEQIAALYPGHADALGLGALPEQEKQKDRDQFEGLPAMLFKYGCTVIDLKAQDREIDQEVITFKSGAACPLLRDLPCFDPADGFRQLNCVVASKPGDNGND